MTQYPVQVNFSFEVDLDIAEIQLSSVKTSVITEGIPEEPITFDVSQAISSYQSAVYLYGDGDLLYAGRIFESQTKYDVSPRPPGSQTSFVTLEALSNSDRWRTKYFNTIPGAGSSNYLTWTNSDDYLIGWSNIERNDVPDGTWRLRAPTEVSGSLPYAIMPYTSITMKINTGITDAEADGINTGYDKPSNITFPHLELTQPTITGGAGANLNKIWIKLGKEKYRLKVYGYFFKWTNKKPLETTTEYTEATYVYNTKTWNYNGLYRSGYSLVSSTSTTKTLTLYEPEYNPSNVKLLVSYVNNRGHNEVRNYTP
jgi:hypothetical protein